MNHATWTAVDDYLDQLFTFNDPALQETLRSSAAAGLPPIHVSPPQGKLLHLLARSIGARRILEIGTLAGYSAIWLARALPPGGMLVTLEVDPRHADVARANFALAGLQDKIDLRVGPAAETLPRLATEHPRAFNFVFVDADKPGYPEYLRWSLQLTSPGGMIVFDNVVRRGAVAADNDDANVLAARRTLELLAAEPRLSTTVLQTVGAKNYDGFALAIVND